LSPPSFFIMIFVPYFSYRLFLQINEIKFILFFFSGIINKQKCIYKFFFFFYFLWFLCYFKIQTFLYL
jgi:hypothetical protein